MANTGNQIDNPFKALNTNTDENPFAKLKKKESGGTAIASPSSGPSESQKDKIFNFLGSVKTNFPGATVTPAKVFTGKPVKKQETIPTILPQNIDEESISKGHQDISDIMFGEGEDWKDPIKALKKKSSEGDLQKAFNSNTAQYLVQKALMPTGFDAKRVYNESEIWKGKEATNQTAKMLKDRADKYDQNVSSIVTTLGDKANQDLSKSSGDLLDMTYTPDLKEAAVEWYAKQNPQFAKELDYIKQSLEKEGWDKSQYGGKIPVQLWQRISSAKMGQIQQQFLNDPDVQSFVHNERPNLAPVFQNAQEKILTDNPEFGINQVASEVSRARQAEGKNNPIFQYYGEHQKEVTNQIAEELYKDDPVKMAIYNQHIRDHQNDHIDAPSFFERFSQGGKDVFSGLSNTVTEPFTSNKETIQNKWKEEASNVSADPQGFSKVMADMGHATGFVASIIGGGEVLGGVTALNPNTANAIMTAGSFLGDSLAEGKSKFPDSPVKAWTSAILKTGLYTALSYEIFPGGKVKQAISKVEPELNQVVEKLASGEISREAAKMETTNLFKKAVELGGTTLTKNARISAEMTGIKMISDTADKLMGAEPHDENYGEIAKSAFLSNLLVAGLAARGEQKVKNKLAEESYYEAASNFKQYERVIQEAAIKDPSINEGELLSNLRYLNAIKTEMDRRGVPEESQKKVLLNSIQEKVKSEQIASMPESAMTRRTKEEIRGLQEDSDRILKGQEGQLSEAVDYGGEKGEVKEGEISKPIPLEPKLPENYQIEISKPIELSKELPEWYKLPEQPTPSSEVNIPKSHVPAAELSAKETAAIGALSTKDLKGTALEHQGEVLKDPTASPEDKRQALWEISDQLTAKGTEAETGQILGKEADLVYDLGYEPPKESAEVKELTDQPTEAPPPGAPGEPVKVTTPEGETVGITHAQMDNLASEFGWPTYEKDPEKVSDWDAQAEARIAKDPQAINTMLNRMKDGKIDDPVDQRMMLKYVASLKARINEKPTKPLLDELKRAKDISNISGRMLGKGLVARKGEVAAEDTLADYLVDRAGDKGRPLSEEQIKTESKKYNELKKEKEKLEVELEKEREQYTRMAAEYGINKARAAARKASKKSHEDYVAERKSAIEDARLALRNLSRGEETHATLPGIAELRAIAPHVKKYMESLVNEGVDKLDNVVTAIHAEFKDVVDGLTKSDIIDIIGGKHDQKGQSKSEKASELRLLKREASLLSKINSEKEGLAKEKSDVKKEDKKENIEKLEKELSEIRKINKQRRIEENPDIQDEPLQKRLTKRIEKLESDLKNKKYEPEPKKEIPFKKTYKTQQLEDKVINLEKQIQQERIKDRLAKRTKSEKVYDFITREILGIKRLVQTIADFSILLRQTGRLAFNPRKWGIFGKEVVKSWNSTWSQKKFDRYMNEIHKAPDFKEMTKDGIRFNEFETNEIVKENEFYYKNWLFKVPILREIPLASQRAADSALNVARYELYQKYKKNLEDQGITRESDPKVYEWMANEVMNQTGSGKLLKMFENNSQAQKVLGNTFYGARLMASNFNQLNPAYYLKMPKEVRGLIWKDIASYVTTIMATGAAAWAAGGQVQFDPDKPDFLQVRFKDKVYDITGGKAQYIRTALRILEAANASRQALSGSKNIRDWRKAWDFAGKSSATFFRNKLAPNTGDLYTWTFGGGKNSIGKDASPIDMLKIYPMYFDDAWTAFENEGLTSFATVLAPNILGIGYNSYYSDPAKQPIEELLERNVQSNEMDLSKYKNYKEHGRELTKEEEKSFINKRDTEIEQGLRKLKSTGYLTLENGSVVRKKYEDLTKEEIVAATSEIKSNATKKIKEELFGKEKKTREEKRAEHELKKAKQKEK